MVSRYGVNFIEGFEEDLSTLLIGVDSLFGGDIMHPSGTEHVIADTWTSGKGAPQIYDDPLSKTLREKGGVPKGKVDKVDVNEYIRKYSLYYLSDKIKGTVRTINGLHPSRLDSDRVSYITNLASSLDVMLKTADAIANGSTLPPFEERMMASTANLGSLELADPAPEREVLRQALARNGFEVTNSRNLVETTKAWHESLSLVSKDYITPKAEITKKLLLDLTRERIFKNIDFGIEGLASDLSDVEFLGHRFETVSDVFFTGSSIYRGGESKGKPLFNGLFELNSDHPISEEALLFLTSHEVIPGHYLNSAIIDLLWRSGKLGFEATVAVMNTPSAVFHEGWAQNAFYLLYGSNEAASEGLFGDDSLAVHLAYEELEDLAKHNVALKHQYRGESLDEVRRYVSEECVQGASVVKKMAGAWSTHPIIGPMYGQAYYLGRTIIRKAIKDFGMEKVARIGFHLDGLVDIATFKRKVEKNIDLVC